MRKQALFIWLILSLILLACGPPLDEEPASTKPNILLMVADDMGYGDLECYGGVSQTPHLNRLAANGLRFTNFYAAAPNCSPSRAGLMTGISPARLGMYNYRPPGHPLHLQDEEVSIAELVKSEGYQTAHIGKWHLGCLPQDSSLNHPQPHDQGFDYSLGTENNAQPSHLNPVNFVRNGVKIGEQKGYSCQLLADEVGSWFQQKHKAEKPFFMYVAFHEPHAKVASPPELVARYSDYPTKDAEYLANIENLDLAIGRIIRQLEERQLLESTLIIFSSDNGSYRLASNGGLKAVKSYLYEGGIRVPAIVHWPELEKKDVAIDEPAGFVDILPTVCDLLGIDPPVEKQLDGTSLLSLLRGEQFARNRPLYWFFYRTSPEIAMRLDNYMILGRDNDSIPRTHRFSAPDMAYIKEMDLVNYELYDLSQDPEQNDNLMDSHPEAGQFQALLCSQLSEIREKGFYWPELPEAQGTKRIKTDWVRY
jgi:arylsulfatase A